MHRSESSTLSQRIAEVQVDDVYERQFILGRIVEARDFLREQGVKAETRVLDAAIVILESFESFPPASAEAAFGILQALVAGIESRLDPSMLRFFQVALRDKDPFRKATPASDQTSSPLEEDVLLGQILENLGVVTSDQIERALQIQKDHGIRIGEALVRIGAATPKHVQRGLRIQHHLRHGNMPHHEREAAAAEAIPALTTSEESANLIGEIFVQLGFTTRDKVDAALRIQRATGVRLGEALAEMGAVTWEQVRQAVEAQRNISRIPGGRIRL